MPTDAAAGRGGIRVLTWNIHGGQGRDRRCDLDRTLRIVAEQRPDLVALQEVDGRERYRRPAGAFETIAEGLRDHLVEARVVRRPDGDYGHILWSRWPFTQTRIHDLSAGGLEPRAAIEAWIDTPFGPLRVVTTHLGLFPRERRRQAEMLGRLAEDRRCPVLIMGDFNDWWLTGAVHRTLAATMPGRVAPRSFPARFPLARFDRIYARPAAVLSESWLVAEAAHASDHLPVMATITLTGSAGEEASRAAWASAKERI